MEGGALAKHQASEDQRKLLAAPAHRWEPRFPFFFFFSYKGHFLFEVTQIVTCCLVTTANIAQLCAIEREG